MQSDVRTFQWFGRQERVHWHSRFGWAQLKKWTLHSSDENNELCVYLFGSPQRPPHTPAMTCVNEGPQSRWHTPSPLARSCEASEAAMPQTGTREERSRTSRDLQNANYVSAIYMTREQWPSIDAHPPTHTHIQCVLEEISWKLAPTGTDRRKKFRPAFISEMCIILYMIKYVKSCQMWWFESILGLLLSERIVPARWWSTNIAVLSYEPLFEHAVKTPCSFLGLFF